MPVWDIETTATRVIATFEGHLDAEEGRRSAQAFAARLAEREVADVVFVVHRMTGYDRQARIAWQNALLPLRNRILGIEIHGGNNLIHMGASVLAMALGVELTIAENRET